MPMIISFASVLLIENTRTKTGGGAAVRAAEHSGAPRSGRGGNRFSQKIGGHPRALRAALAAVMLGLSRRAPPPPAIMARPSGQRTVTPAVHLRWRRIDLPPRSAGRRTAKAAAPINSPGPTAVTRRR